MKKYYQYFLLDKKKHIVGWSAIYEDEQACKEDAIAEIGNRDLTYKIVPQEIYYGLNI